MRDITEIVLHTTATRPDWWADRSTADKVNEIRRWHVEDRGWKDIGYHYLIDRDGAQVTGRPIAKDGAHVMGHNKGTIGIALFGGHGSAVTDAFAENYTPEQEKALRKLLVQLHKNFGKVPVTGHNQYAAKACPGFEVPKWFEGPNVVLPSVAMPEKVIVPVLVDKLPEEKPDAKVHGAFLVLVFAVLSAALLYIMKG